MTFITAFGEPLFSLVRESQLVSHGCRLSLAFLRYPGSDVIVSAITAFMAHEIRLFILSYVCEFASWTGSLLSSSVVYDYIYYICLAGAWERGGRGGEAEEEEEEEAEEEGTHIKYVVLIECCC